MSALDKAQASPAPAQAPWPIVLYFHHIGRKLPHFTSLSVGQFAYVLELLEEHCDLLPASALVDERPASTDRPAVVISFDDGYAETFSTVLPLLSDRKLTAAFFVVTSEIGQELDHTTLDVPLRRASWTELRAACARRTRDRVTRPPPRAHVGAHAQHPRRAAPQSAALVGAARAHGRSLRVSVRCHAVQCVRARVLARLLHAEGSRDTLGLRAASHSPRFYRKGR